MNKYYTRKEKKIRVDFLVLYEEIHNPSVYGEVTFTIMNAVFKHNTGFMPFKDYNAFIGARRHYLYSGQNLLQNQLITK